MACYSAQRLYPLLRKPVVSLLVQVLAQFQHPFAQTDRWQTPNLMFAVDPIITSNTKLQRSNTKLQSMSRDATTKQSSFTGITAHCQWGKHCRTLYVYGKCSEIPLYFPVYCPGAPGPDMALSCYFAGTNVELSCLDFGLTLALEQFWGRAVRASHDSKESGALLIWGEFSASPLTRPPRTPFEANASLPRQCLSRS